jgi:hypothetical protein
MMGGRYTRALEQPDGAIIRRDHANVTAAYRGAAKHPVRKMAGDYEQLADLADERDNAKPRMKRHGRLRRCARRAKERRV